jgi:hypothetical protein
MMRNFEAATHEAAGTCSGAAGSKIDCDTIFRVKGMYRILTVLLVVAALPLRGYAALAADLCADHGGKATTGQASEHNHDHGAADDPKSSGNTDHHSTASVCSHCAACSVGASLAPDASKAVTALPGGADRIPFFDTRKPGYVPDHPERPPLVS